VAAVDRGYVVKVCGGGSVERCLCLTSPGVAWSGEGDC
jgi:hypothetical protein